MPSKSSKPRKSTSARKAKKSSTTATAAAPTTAAPEPVVAAAVPEPVAAVAAVTESVVAAAATATESVELNAEPTLDAQFKDILDRIVNFRTLATNLMADVKKLQKNVNKQVRESNKRNRKRRGTDASGAKRPPSGFAKPTKISDALCQFLGQPSGTEMARTEVTKHLTKYIKEHKLQDPANKRIINCDSHLKTLLNVKSSDEVTYFNLQRYMKPHFPSKASTA